MQPIPPSIRHLGEVAWFGFTADDADSYRAMHDIGFGSWKGWARCGSASRAWRAEETTSDAIGWIQSFAGTAADPTAERPVSRKAVRQESLPADAYEVKDSSRTEGQT